MRIALIYPPSTATTVAPPLGIGYLAAYLEQAGYATDVYDLARYRGRHRKVLAEITRTGYDLFGLSVTTPNYVPAKEVAETLRRCAPATPLIIGGAHVSPLPELCLRDFDATFATTGESEMTLVELVQAMDDDAVDFSHIHGLTWKRGDGLVTNPPRAILDDLDTLPFIPWEKFELKKYPKVPHQLLANEYPIAPIMTTRGCPYPCTYCSTPTLFGKKIRRRSARHVVDEMERAVRDYGVREFHVEDDNFTFHRDHAVDVCEEILRRDLTVGWKCPNGVRIDHLDRELIRLMKRAGCYQVSVGIETANQSAMDRVKKKLKVSIMEETLIMMAEEGMEVQGLFMLGLPGETPEMVRETIRFAVHKPFDLAHFSVLTPLPGSPLFQEILNEKGGRVTDVFASINFFTPYPIGDLSVKTLKRLQREAVFRFYLRPKTIKLVAQKMRVTQIPGVAHALYKYSF